MFGIHPSSYEHYRLLGMKAPLRKDQDPLTLWKELRARIEIFAQLNELNGVVGIGQFNTPLVSRA